MSQQIDEHLDHLHTKLQKAERSQEYYEDGLGRVNEALIGDEDNDELIQAQAGWQAGLEAAQQLVALITCQIEQHSDRTLIIP